MIVYNMLLFLSRNHKYKTLPCNFNEGVIIYEYINQAYPLLGVNNKIQFCRVLLLFGKGEWINVTQQKNTGLMELIKRANNVYSNVHKLSPQATLTNAILHYPNTSGQI